MTYDTKSGYTEQEYLALERCSEAKHEYFGGDIFAMGGASQQHVLIVTNMVADLHSQLKRIGLTSNIMFGSQTEIGSFTKPTISETRFT